MNVCAFMERTKHTLHQSSLPIEKFRMDRLLASCFRIELVVLVVKKWFFLYRFYLPLEIYIVYFRYNIYKIEVDIREEQEEFCIACTVIREEMWSYAPDGVSKINQITKENIFQGNYLCVDWMFRMHFWGWFVGVVAVEIGYLERLLAIVLESIIIRMIHFAFLNWLNRKWTKNEWWRLKCYVYIYEEYKSLNKMMFYSNTSNFWRKSKSFYYYSLFVVNVQ